jgi:hypothetical protein
MPIHTSRYLARYEIHLLYEETAVAMIVISKATDIPAQRANVVRTSGIPVRWIELSSMSVLPVVEVSEDVSWDKLILP